MGYEPGCTNHKLLPVLPGPLAVDYFAAPDLSGPVVFREERAGGEVMWFREVAPGVYLGLMYRLKGGCYQFQYYFALETCCLN